MVKLLVSVRDGEEARLALAGGADLIDVKEPARGPLGAADPLTMESVVEVVSGRAPVSVALGELAAGSRLAASLAGRIAYAKLGLAGTLGTGDWRLRWKRAIERLPKGVEPVAVAYADWGAAAAPGVWEVLESGCQLGCRALLVDTFDKRGGALGAHLTWAELERVIAATKKAKMACVLAGRLGPREIAKVLPLGPDYIAVRGAACAGGRTGRIDVSRVRRLAALVHSHRDRALAGSR
jgi:uncharacterized protein (UPF0264 family)